MAKAAQRRAVKTYRSRVTKRSLARFEVLGLNSDRDLIRSLARRLAEDGREASSLRAAIHRTITGEPLRRAASWPLCAIRRSFGADLDLTRVHDDAREVDLSCASLETWFAPIRPISRRS
jgi:hypothetical protein